MRVFIIDPKERSITLRDLFEKDALMLEAFQYELGGLVDRVEIGTWRDMWICDEGACLPGNAIFFLGELGPFAGNGIVCAHNGEGKSEPAGDWMAELLLDVRWTEQEASGQFYGEETAAERTPSIPPGAIFIEGALIPQLKKADQYLIWSNEHRAWWAPGSNGYVQRLAEAGRYSRQHALQICKDAQGGWNGLAPAPEIAVPERDALAAGLAGRSFG